VSTCAHISSGYSRRFHSNVVTNETTRHHVWTRKRRQGTLCFLNRARHQYQTDTCISERASVSSRLIASVPRTRLVRRGRQPERSVRSAQGFRRTTRHSTCSHSCTCESAARWDCPPEGTPFEVTVTKNRG
jgi:hypothetical protein